MMPERDWQISLSVFLHLRELPSVSGLKIPGYG
jgi:hypothetical protein